MSTEGSRYGYHVKPSKSWLILKDPQKLQAAEILFKNSQIKITTSGKRHLGASLGTDGFKTTYMTEKVKDWCEKMNRLTEIAKLQPHAAYAAYIHAEQHRHTYFLRTIDGIKDLLKSLDDMTTFKERGLILFQNL